MLREKSCEEKKDIARAHETIQARLSDAAAAETPTSQPCSGKKLLFCHPSCIPDVNRSDLLRSGASLVGDDVVKVVGADGEVRSLARGVGLAVDLDRGGALGLLAVNLGGLGDHVGDAGGVGGGQGVVGRRGDARGDREGDSVHGAAIDVGGLCSVEGWGYAARLRLM